MHYYPQPTPCPPSAYPYPVLRPTHPYAYAPYPQPAYTHYAAPSLSSHTDDTSNLEFTTELQAHARNVKPRRPTARRKETFDPSSDIFQDEAARSEEVSSSEVGKKKAKATSKSRKRESTMLSQPPQRNPSIAAAVNESDVARPRRKRVSEILSERHEEVRESTSKKEHGKKDDHDRVRKDPRRRDIYIPSEDTNIMTIHPGAASHKHPHRKPPRSPDIGLDLVTLSEEDSTSELKSALKKPVPRKSLAAAPKRVPLQPSTRPLQSVSFFEDIVGSGDGKENMRPEKSAVEVAKRKIIREAAPEPVATKPPPKAEARRKAEEVTASLRSRTGKKRNSTESEHAMSPATKSLKARANATATARGPTGNLRSSPAEVKRRSPLGISTGNARNVRPDKAPSKLGVPLITQKTERHSLSKYPVLSEDLAKPELYEDNWLRNQEIALTQLLNSLFESAETKPFHSNEERDLRKRLLMLYNEASFAALHKRLHASLQFGALSISKDLLTREVRLRDDIGLRRKFLNLFTETFNLELLQAALETIIGRQMPQPKRLSQGEDTSRQQRHLRKAIEDFLEVFLIRNEDAVKVKGGVGSIASIARGTDSRQDEFGSQAWAWQRTVLRSLMLILLLDKGKKLEAFNTCLFQPSSPHKSSTAVLQALGSLVLPSLGDIIRPLTHLNYQVYCVQYPLEELTYRINNLATDLRDGVLLTRVVELLLYSPITLAAQETNDVTVTLPTGELLTAVFDLNQVNKKETWVLSQHLKFPCVGRVQKLYNVQIALSALEGVKGVPSKVAQDVKAEDIVDGHREKTLGLLWGLVGRCGLNTLINWREVEKEITRLRHAWYQRISSDSDSDDSSSSEEEQFDFHNKKNSLKYHAQHLQTWAHHICRLRNIRITNLTTSFASTKPFEAIVDEYLPYCTTLPVARKATMETKLAAIGCSNAFTSLFTPTSTTIPTRDFTVSTLAFLASRLLPLVRATRAACAIQRFYRARLAKREVTKRVALMRLAHHCAIVVQTRERVVEAAIVLQRAWRGVLDERMDSIVRHAVTIQSLARGWKARKTLKTKTSKGKAKKERTRWGW